MTVERFARALIGAAETGGHAEPDWLPATSVEAYAVQSRVSAHFGAVGGWKTGRKPGHVQTMAPIRADRVVASGAEWSMGACIGVELEIGWQVLQPLDLSALADRSARVAMLRPVVAIELVATRLTGPIAAEPLAKLADCQVNTGLVVGPAQADWTGDDFDRVEAHMLCGETVLLDGVGQVPGGSALETLRGLAEIAADHCGGLQPGQVLVTGSMHPLHYVDTPVTVRGEIVGLGKVAVNLR